MGAKLRIVFLARPYSSAVMSTLDVALPSSEGRERLLAGLANVLRGAGWERFVTAPIVEPDPRRWRTRSRMRFVGAMDSASGPTPSKSCAPI